MGIRLNGQNLSAMLTIALVSCLVFVLEGCMLARSPLGCPEASDDNGRCILSDAGPVDAFVMMTDGDIRDAGPDAPDAFRPDAELPDGGPDAWVDPDGGPPDSGPPDGGPPDGGPRDGGPPDGGPPPPLRITFNGATGPTGIAFQVWWIPGPVMPPVYSEWYYRACRITRSGSMVTCEADAPELASGRHIDFFPFDDTLGAAVCTAVTCPSLCTRTECPTTGPVPGSFGSYSVEYPVGTPTGTLTLNSDSGTAVDGPAPGDTAWIHTLL